MNRKLRAAIVFVGAASMTSAVPRGTVPKTSVQNYRAHAERDGVGVGAELLSSDQVNKIFAANVNKCCVVLEVAFYPPKDKSLDVSLDDLTMKADGSDTLVRPLSARAVAATLQEKEERDQNKNVSVATNVGVGYESGTYIDPVTGQPVKVHGVSTEAGVGVGVGQPGNTPRPGASNRNRDDVEVELAEHGLVEGAASAPVSGYLYFSKPEKMKKGTPLRLQYAMKDQTVILSLP